MKDYSANSLRLKIRIQYGIDKKKPVAGVMPPGGIRAKDLVAEMTTVNTESKDLKGKLPIKTEHVDNNEEVREALKKKGIKPEELPPEQDTKAIERKIR